MRIFNWMNRKLHPSIKYSQVSQKKNLVGGDDEEKGEVIFEGVMEKEALLLHDVLNGILTIGTLGHQESLLSQSYPTQEDEVLLQEELEEDVEVEEKDEGKKVAPAPVIESLKFELPAEAKGKQMEMVVQDIEEIEKIQELPLLKEDKEKREVGRTTLADLFAADAFMVNDPAQNASKLGTNAEVEQHAAVSDKKKKEQMNKKKEEKWTSATTNTTTTNRKLPKLITKMSKKKIHPESMAVVPRAADMHIMKDGNKEACDGLGSSIHWRSSCLISTVGFCSPVSAMAGTFEADAAGPVIDS